MHIVTLPRGSYTSSIVGEREEKRGQNHKTFLLRLFRGTCESRSRLGGNSPHVTSSGGEEPLQCFMQAFDERMYLSYHASGNKSVNV
jgi:hypothetical protein